ncbi:MAG: asparagine synthase (glutamine-hydrolyzing) [Moheibacter sp.]
MCGFLGSINSSFDYEILNLIKHRGPDYGHINQIQIGENIVYQGHRRLSILDLSSEANQPMFSDDLNCSIIFNGEIYNHSDLRKSMSEVDFKTHSDTETILYHLKKHGIEGVADFNGIFAFCFLDKKKGELYLVRDQYGVKPVYYHIEDRKLVFSSEIRAIKSLTQNSFNSEALPELLKLRYNPSPDTLYKKIKRLRPGHILTYKLENHELDIQPYFRPITPKKEINLNQAIHQYGDLFEKAVKKQMMSDVEIGTLLSGGVDSALVTYFAKEFYSKPMKSFTVGYEGIDSSNELNEAKESAEFLKTEHHEVIINQSDFHQLWMKVIGIIEEPLASTSAIPMYFLSKEVADKHIKVVLTGQGADEPLGGYERYKSEIYRKYLPSFVFNLFKPINSLIKNEKLRRFIYSAGEPDKIKRFEKSYSIFSDREIKKLTGADDTSSYDKIKYFYDLLGGRTVSSLEAMMALDMKLNLADDLLLYTDKVSMHFGVEARVPFLDFELIEFIESLPTKFKINKNGGKLIHKEFAKSVLPEKIVNRPKKGFLSPTQKWFSQNSEIMIETLIKENNPLFNQLFEMSEIMRIINRHKSGVNQEKQLFLIFSIFYWLKNANLPPLR